MITVLCPPMMTSATIKRLIKDDQSAGTTKMLTWLDKQSADMLAKVMSYISPPTQSPRLGSIHVVMTTEQGIYLSCDKEDRQLTIPNDNTEAAMNAFFNALPMPTSRTSRHMTQHDTIMSTVTDDDIKSYNEISANSEKGKEVCMIYDMMHQYSYVW